MKLGPVHSLRVNLSLFESILAKYMTGPATSWQIQRVSKPKYCETNFITVFYALGTLRD